MTWYRVKDLRGVVNSQTKSKRCYAISPRIQVNLSAAAWSPAERLQQVPWHTETGCACLQKSNILILDDLEQFRGLEWNSILEQQVCNQQINPAQKFIKHHDKMQWKIWRNIYNMWIHVIFGTIWSARIRVLRCSVARDPFNSRLEGLESSHYTGALASQDVAAVARRSSDICKACHQRSKQILRKGQSMLLFGGPTPQ